MLSAIRERSKGTVAWIIVILIIIPFALWGVDQFNSGDRIQVAAKVNGDSINSNEVGRALDNVKRQYQEAFGDMYRSLVKEETLQQQVLDDLIQRMAIDQQINKEGFAISDALLAQIIQSQDVFQQDGEFSLQQYEQVLRNNGFSKERFERAQRDFVLRNQLESIIASSSFLSEQELQQLAKLEAQEREVSYLVVDHRPFLATAEVSDAQVSDYYQANLAQFLADETVSVDYLHLSVADIAKQVSVSDEQIEDYYQDNQAALTQAEQRNVRHILIQAEGEDSEAEARLTAILAEIKAGADFAELAKQHSDDPGSGARGGELGFFQRGDMVAEFEQAAFALTTVDELSPIIRSQFGYHLLQLVAIEAAHTPSLAETKAGIEQELRFELAQKQYHEQLEELKTLVFEQDDSLQPAADALGLSIKTSATLTRQGGDDLFASPAVIEAAFSPMVIQDKLNSSVVEAQLGEAVVMRLHSHQPSHEKALDEVRDTIVERLKKDNAMQQAQAKAEALLADLTAGKPAAELAGEGVQYHQPLWLSRYSEDIDTGIVAASFKSNKPQGDTLSWSQQQLASGDTVVLAVSAVRVQDELLATSLQNMRQAVVQVFGDAELEALTADIKAKATVEILLK